MVLAGGTGVFVVPEVFVYPICHSCPEPVWFQKIVSWLQLPTLQVWLCRHTSCGIHLPEHQATWIHPSVHPAAARAGCTCFGEENGAIRVILVYFAGDDNFLPAAHSLINRSEDVGQRRNEHLVCISKGSVINIPALTRALRRQAGHRQGCPARCAGGSWAGREKPQLRALGWQQKGFAKAGR